MQATQLTATQLIGLTAAEVIRGYLSGEDSQDGVARILLDRLTGPQVAEICRAILADPQLREACEIRVPRLLVEGENLPESIVTDEKTTHFRHSNCEKSGLILANTNDDQAESLGLITSIGAPSLKERADEWVSIASKGNLIPEEHLVHWIKALIACGRASEFSLDQFAQYVSDTRHRIESEGVALVQALGWSLPALRIPRDTGFFEAIPDKFRGQVNRWQRLFNQAVNKRKCLLVKETPSRKSIDPSDLLATFERVREDIPEDKHELIRTFIEAPSGWNTSSQALAECEWEIDSIGALFSGIRTRKLDLVSATLQLFDDEYQDTLTDDELQYLEGLRARSSKEPTDEDADFYEKYRGELEHDKGLRAKWDKLVYGSPIECGDFLVGLLQCIERLRDQMDSTSSTRELRIKSQKRNSRSNWLQLNADVGLYFCTRYRGLQKLLGPRVTWDVPHLFDYDELLTSEARRKKTKYKRNKSAAKAATELKFFVELVQNNTSVAQTQLIWRCKPDSIGMELHDDLDRLLRNSPLLVSDVYRELTSKKGRLQGLSLEDVGTLAAAFRQDRGSLVGKYNRKADLAKIVPDRFNKAIKEGRIRSEGEAELKEKWEHFTDSYRNALTEWFSGRGIASPALIEQAEAYSDLLATLLVVAPGDRNREELLEPILGLGCVAVKGGTTTSIVAPWNPLRLCSIAVKARQLSGLIQHILTAENLDFGDSRVFFQDLRQEMQQPYYPEVCLGYKSEMAQLLGESVTVNDYSLMERPIRGDDSAVTNEDPTESAERIKGLVKRYLELMPHERANLCIALYNCDSIKLPQAVVNKLSELQDDEEEARCQIILRHEDSSQLSDLFQQLLESSDSDPDALITSEVSRDFIARLRIGVKADSLPVSDSGSGKFTDIVFLQGAISRRANEGWEESPFENEYPNVIEHVPPRWSRRKPAVRDDQKSTVYLSCPFQPTVGSTYLNALYSVLKGTDVDEGKSYLPVRQVQFRDDNTKRVLREVHELGEWVANVDDILERRQLVNQGIRVIRYQESRADRQSFIVSSTSSLSLLHVLIKRRLVALNLGLDETNLSTLTQRLVDDANQISGDIVLRAAKNGHFASELVGICLSRFILESELGKDFPVGWYFLDDYASWLGQKEGRIADILVLCPRETDKGKSLSILVSESKYVDASGMAEARKSSQKQLRETIDRINSALFLTPGRLDRDLWLSRVGDLLLNGLDVSPTADTSIEIFRNELRAGRVPIELRGYSHVFVSGPPDSDLDSERVPIAHSEGCYQEVFGREHVRKLLLAYHNGKSATSVREGVEGDRCWDASDIKLPAPPVSWPLTIDYSDTDHKGIVESSSVNGMDSSTEVNVKAAETPTEPAEQDRYVNAEPSGHSPESVDAVPEWSSSSLSTWLKKTDSQKSHQEEDLAWLKEIVGKLGIALRSYDLQSKVLGQRLTPNAALVSLKGSDRLTIEQIEKRTSQLLTTHGIGVINVVGKPGEVLVSIARPNRETVSLRDLWLRRKVNLGESGLNLSLLVGVKEVDGELLYLNLAGPFGGLQQHAPHTLIAGATGSGKSVLLQNLLLDISVTNDPHLARIYLIDPKAGVDYSMLETLPHLVEGIIIDQERAIEVLESLVSEMDRRYLQFREHRVKDLHSFNASVAKEKRLPALFLVHDEFAEWMLIDEYKSAVSTAVQRLGVKARAAGIYLIFAAQRPDANVLPVQLRDNLGNRLILRVESIGTSEITLGMKGAERLLGKGHLAARLMGESDIIFAQVPFVSDQDLESLCSVMSDPQ
ncbi:MAG: FtsK/SpoIIIE domain-containing protein [Candidatus Obscuribacterales bacterium]